ncbi:retinitis pigmentosa 1-like 1 protein [Thalassophryne amazonica]|uniref:retinitis pigmentosa 1-like 1 protein n=1 Tax=Thalassophryne amazonica TaxID=390379 RepID=UPI001471CC38|nr:retinitis pigmentosa 1-like 1 protein [Thalassophryne amazonica]
MRSAQAGMRHPQSSSKHAFPFPPQPPSNSRLARVTTATPAKRITFYRSGDNQFGGVRMAIHKRSFKCFDALLDDLSQKVPLPFGVRTVTTPHGTHTIKHLEQLQDGGCYLCSDQRQAKPINLELTSKGSSWYRHSRRLQQTQTTPHTPPGHLPYRQRRILLIKNSKPGLRRTIVLSRKSSRSLMTFIDEVSSVMQFRVQKLYTAEGRRIDSIPSLMMCPGVLVCVGRETFSPFLVNFIKKNSEDKLPGLPNKSHGLGPRTPGNGARSPATQRVRSLPHGTQSKASEYSEGLDGKKSVNFGLETKKSIIHPRTNSSSRSTRLSLSSEKSCGNGSSTHSHPRPAIMNDDIEKRVLVNQDGSLSVEMRVRFRIQNEETLQWSTLIKKSPSLLQQSQSESWSDPDSTSFDTEGADYSNLPLQRGLDLNYCPCCYQKEDLQCNLWENRAHRQKQCPIPPLHTSSHTRTIRRHTHSSSSSSSCNSQVRLSNYGGKLEPQQGQLVQKEMCVTQQVEHRVEMEQDGDTHVEVCKVSRSCSRSEVLTMDNNLQTNSRKSVSDDQMMEEEEERALSAASSSSQILQALKEDQGDEDEPQGIPNSDSSPSETFDVHHNGTPTGVVSAASVASTRQEREDRNSTLIPTVQADVDAQRGSPTVSAVLSCNCRADTTESTPEAGELEQATRSKSKISTASSKGIKARILTSEQADTLDDGDEERAVSGLSGHTGFSKGSRKSLASSACPNCGGLKRRINADFNSADSHRSYHVSPQPGSPLSNQNNTTDDVEHQRATSGMSDGSDVSAVSRQSNKSNGSIHGCLSEISNGLEGKASGPISRASNPDENKAQSVTSNTSHRSGYLGFTHEKEEVKCLSGLSVQSKASESSLRGSTDACNIRTEGAEGANAVERVVSSLSFRSGSSIKTSTPMKSQRSHKSSTCSSIGIAAPDDSLTVQDHGQRAASVLSVKSTKEEQREEKRPESVLSVKSAQSGVSAKSRTSSKSNSSMREEIVEGTGQAEETKVEERTISSISDKSNMSEKLSKSHKITKEAEGSGEERAASEISSKSLPTCYDSLSSEHQKTKVAEESEKGEEGDTEKRAASALSGKLAFSPQSHHCMRAPSPGNDDTQLDKVADRVSSAMSGRSGTSVKSRNSNRSANPQNPNVPSTEASGDQMQSDQQERVASAMSVKSRLSSNNVSAASTSPDTADRASIKTLEVVDGEEDQTAEMEQSAPSAKSGESNISNKSNHNETRGVVVIEPATADEEIVEDDASGSSSCKNISSTKEKASSDKGAERCNSALTHSGHTLSPRSSRSRLSLPPKVHVISPSSPESPGQQGCSCPDLGKTRGTGALSVHSTGSTKSNRSKCSSGGIAVIETPDKSKDQDQEITERDDCALSSNHSYSAKSKRSHQLSCNCGIKVSTPMPNSTYKEDPARSSKTKTRNDLETDSAKSASSRKDNPDKTMSSIHLKNPSCLGSESTVSVQSSSKIKTSKQSKGEFKSDDSLLKPAKGHKANASIQSAKRSNSQKKQTQSKSSSPRPIHNSNAIDASSDSTRPHSLSAAEFLKETACPNNHHSNSSTKSRTKEDQEEWLELTPACLPNASPNEVVSNWLQSIPANSCMLTLDDELAESEEQEKEVKEEDREEVAKEKRDPEGEKVEEEEVEEKGQLEEDEKDEQIECNGAEKDQSSEEAPPDTLDVSHPTNHLLSDDSLPKNWHSSAAVMKVLLGSSLGRCRSLPEVSPVYGRRLSTSAKGLLDCLAQLQLIAPAVNLRCDRRKDCNQHYEDIMVILQSLWLTEPKDIKDKEPENVGKDQVTPPTSSSGVDTSSGSGRSGDGSRNNGDDTPPKQTTSLLMDEGAEVPQDQTDLSFTEPNVKEKSSQQCSTVLPSLDSPKAIENPSCSDSSSTNNYSKSPTDNEQETLEDSSGTPTTVQQASLSKRLSQDPDPVWILHLLKKLEKQFMDHYINAMAEFKVRWDLDDSIILDKMISELKDEVSRRIQTSVDREMKKIQSRAGRLPMPPQRLNLSRQSTMMEKRRRLFKILLPFRPDQEVQVMKNQSVKTGESLSDGELTDEFSDQRSDDEFCPCEACVRKKMAARPLKKRPGECEAPVMKEFDLLKILQLKKNLPGSAAVPQPGQRDDNTDVVDDERTLETVKEEEKDSKTKDIIQPNGVLKEGIPEEFDVKEKELGKKLHGHETCERMTEEKKNQEQEEAEPEEVVAAQKEKDKEGSSEEARGEETPENRKDETEEDAECQRQTSGNEEESETTEEGNTVEKIEEEQGEKSSSEGERGDDSEEKSKDGEPTADRGQTDTEEEESDKDAIKEARRDDAETTGNEESEQEEVNNEEAEDCVEDEERSCREPKDEKEDNCTGASRESSPSERHVEVDCRTSDNEDEGGSRATESESQEDESRSEEASEENRALAQGQKETEEDERDAENSDTDTADKSACEDDDEEKGGGRDENKEEVVEDTVEALEHEEEGDNVDTDVKRNKRVSSTFCHQHTRTSVESQHGSLEDTR